MRKTQLTRRRLITGESHQQALRAIELYGPAIPSFDLSASDAELITSLAQTIRSEIRYRSVSYGPDNTITFNVEFNGSDDRVRALFPLGEPGEGIADLQAVRVTKDRSMVELRRKHSKNRSQIRVRFVGDINFADQLLRASKTVPNTIEQVRFSNDSVNGSLVARASVALRLLQRAPALQADWLDLWFSHSVRFEWGNGLSSLDGMTHLTDQEYGCLEKRSYVLRPDGSADVYLTHHDRAHPTVGVVPTGSYLNFAIT